MRPTSFDEFASLLNIHHSSRAVVHGVAIDSRQVKEGDLFFALPGKKVDGHTFLKDVALKGAIGAVVREDFCGDDHGLSLLRVPDVTLALQEMARKSLARRSSQVIAITGSHGKTTTKEFTAAFLRTRYKIFASPLSYNSQLTLPLCILLADGDEDYLILEMGMSHEGNLKQLISVAPPDIALITAIAPQHAVNFSDGISGISREKASIFTHQRTRLGIVHRDICHYDQVISTGDCPKKTFSLKDRGSDYFLETLPNGVRVHVKGEKPYECLLNLPNKVHYHNFLAAVALAQILEISPAQIREVAPTLQLPPMRFEKVERQGILFINDAYNANPEAMQAAIENLPKPPAGKKTIAVLSEMDALGSHTEEGHRRVAEVALQHVDYLLCIGSHCETMHAVWARCQKPAQLFQTKQDLCTTLKDLVEPGDVVLLKGARSYALDQVLSYFP